jgi:hypothetical protein
MIKRGSKSILWDALFSFDYLFRPEPNYNSNQESLGYVNKPVQEVRKHNEKV